MAAAGHPDEIHELFDRLLEASPATGRHVELASGRQAHVIEAGAGDPLVMMHPGGTSALLFLPLIARLTGLRVMAVDRPGFGLSDPIDFTRDSFRSSVISWMSQVLDALGLEETALLGSSMGGTWSLWYALEHPEQIEVQVAAGRDPVVAQANREEMRAVGTAFGGLRRELRLQPDQLARLNVPTLIVWGEHDPLGDPSVARALAEAIPGARLELLPTAHMPWFAESGRTAELVEGFVGV